MDTKAIEEHIRGILVALGDDPSREGLIDTPKRVAKMYEEVFAGMAYTNHEIAEMFGKVFDNEGAEAGEGVVVMKDIGFFSYCEHHMALMYDMKATVAYIPTGKVIGCRKLPVSATWWDAAYNFKNASAGTLPILYRRSQAQKMWL